MSTHPSSPLNAKEAAPAGFRFGRESSVRRASGDSEWSVDWVLDRFASDTNPSEVVASHRKPLGGLFGAFAVLCAVALGVASMFWSHGAQVVLPLAWLQLMLVGAGVWAVAQRFSDHERIVLRGNRLTVERASGLHVERVEFQPAWVRVEPEHGDRSLVELSGQGRRIAVGRFVRPELRRQLAEELRLALRRWHQGAPKPASM